MSSYDEHLISMAGGDGEPATSRKLTEHHALCIWEDNVGDSGKAPTNLELLTFANAARDPLLALVREQQARIERGNELVRYLDRLAPGDKHYAGLIRAALRPTP